VVEIPIQPTRKTPKILGVDLGRRDIATTSEGKSWDGKQLKETRARFTRVRASIQTKRTKSSKKLLRRLSGSERRFQAWINHNISKQLVCDANEIKAAIAFEDLTGIARRRKRAEMSGKPTSPTDSTPLSPRKRGNQITSVTLKVSNEINGMQTTKAQLLIA
jgi:transposase